MMALERSPIRVVGRYALYNEIAAGGMATIHLGRLLGPVGFARTVAVKRLHPQFAKDPEFVSMFLDEARLAARVQHPNVVATIDVVATDGELFLIMDYVRGESLSKILRTLRKRGQRPPARIAAAIMCGFLHGLHAAHEAKNERGEPLGLVHRDVSPQNVLVGSDGIARVLDFGIAKAQGRIQVTRDGQIKGKLAYMPPEQLAGRELTRAVDIYASAVVMWETLTGERLFKGETEGQTLAKILRDPISPPSAIATGLGNMFDGPLLRSLSRDVSKRHTTAKELALELERCCGIASPTEVGEWVEHVVGHVLNAREEQIAAIESSSAGMSVSQSVRPGPISPDSDGDISMPSSRAIRAASSPIDTLPMGSGPPSSIRASVARLHSANQPTPHSVPTTPRASNHGPAGPSYTSGGRPLSDEGTGSKSAIGLLTGTMLMLPVDRKLPVIASIAGIIVLIIVMAVIIGGKFSSNADAKPVIPPPPIPSATAEGTPPPRPTGDDRALPDPLASASAEQASGDDPPPEPKTSNNDPRPAPHQRPVPNGHVAPKAPVVTAKPSTAPPPVAPSPVKKNCDPPYNIDSQGRRKYKLECM
jgi:eukaryotic-like serine/threonine-protein kinase